MKKTIMLSLLLATGLANAVETNTVKLNTKQVTFEVGFERVTNNKHEVLNNFTLSTLMDQAAPVEFSKTITYVEGCAVNVVDNTNTLIPGTYTYGLKSNIKIHEGKEKDTYLAEVEFDYSDLMSITKFKVKDCEIDLLQKFGWDFRQIVELPANKKISVGENLYPQFRQTPTTLDAAEYKITLKVLK
jgi:hypothetical protein